MICSEIGALVYFLEPKTAQRLYKMPIDSRIEVQLLGNLPLFADRGGFYFRVSELRESLKGVGKARPLAGAPTRLADLEANSIDDFNRDCLRQVDEKTPLTESVLEMIREAKATTAPSLFLLKCRLLSPEHVLRFYGSTGWPLYRDYVLSLLQQQQVEFLDSSKWLTGTAFIHRRNPSLSQWLGGLHPRISPGVATG